MVNPSKEKLCGGIFFFHKAVLSKLFTSSRISSSLSSIFLSGFNSAKSALKKALYRCRMPDFLSGISK